MNFKSKKKQQDLTAKFYFPGSSKKSGVELRFITDEMRRAAFNELVHDDIDFVIHPVTKKLTKVVTQVTPKNVVLEDWIIDNMIVSWWGISLDDKPLDCIKENKLMLYRDEQAFNDFVEESYRALKESAEKSFGSASEIKN